MNKSFKVPRFSPRNIDHSSRTTVYYWWSWHPMYPYWSKSCWGGKTKKEAFKALKKPLACKMECYYNKLIREKNGVFTEVADLPPTR